jgi:hypothetical protein
MKSEAKQIFSSGKYFKIETKLINTLDKYLKWKKYLFSENLLKQKQNEEGDHKISEKK